MPPVVKQSGLMAKYGAKLDAAVKAHSSDETNYGRIDLPPGIKGGVAQLVECKFDQYKSGDQQGEWYFRAAGVVLEPKEVEYKGQVVPVAGQHTSIMIAVCDTTTQGGKVTTVEQHVAQILNEMRKLGAETAGAGAADMEGIAASLKDAQPFFRFSTSERKDQTSGDVTGVWENWNGNKGLENYIPPADDGTVDNTSIGEGSGQTGDAANPPDDTAGEDYDALLTAANETDAAVASPAQTRLVEIAVEKGVCDKDTAEGAPSWEDLVSWIKGESKPGEAAAAPAEPDKGETWKYAPPDPKDKTGKRKLKAIECQVTAVNKPKRTADLKSLTNTKDVFKGVSWDEMEPVS